jgi:hypothetical protein
MKKIALFTLFATIIAPHAFAWGEQGHTIVNEAATLALPSAMPPFFNRAFPELIWLGPEPDRWHRGRKVQEAANFPDHFLDYEYAQGLVLPPDRYKFIDLLGASGRLRQHGIDSKNVGFLPWRIAELSEMLELEFRNWRRAEPGSAEQRALEVSIIQMAGTLGHYAGDSSQPLHATVNHNGWLDENPYHYTADCDMHARFETGFVSHAGLQLPDVLPLVASETHIDDYFAAAVAQVEASNALVEKTYRIDRDGGLDYIRPASREARDFVAARLAVGASFLRDLWLSAWANSATQPSTRATAP